MENLFFVMQTDKQYKRQMRLLNYLKKVHSSVSITELSRELSCSAPTLRSDIKSLNLKMPENFVIKYQEREGVTFTYPEWSSIDFCIMDLAKQSLSFQLIDNIFRQRNFSFLQAMEQLFISESTLRKTIHHMNQVLKEYQIAISPVDLQFTGRETDIRFFLFSFYSDFRDYCVMYNINDTESRTYIHLLRSAKKAKLPKLHYSYFRATIWIMVIKERMFSKQFISIEESVQQKIVAKKSFQRFYQVFYKLFAPNFSQRKNAIEEAIWMYQVCLHCISYSDPIDQKDNETEDYVYTREEPIEIIEEKQAFLELFFGGKKIDTKELEKIRAFLINLSSLSQLSPLFEKVSYPLKNFIKSTQRELFILWYDYLKKSAPVFPVTYPEDVAVSLTMLSFSIFDREKQKKPHVLFSFQGESGYDEYLVHSSKMMIPEHVQTEYHLHGMVTEKVIKEKQTDLVVCNYELPFIKNPSCRIMRLSYIPTMTEWMQMKAVLYQLTNE